MTSKYELILKLISINYLRLVISVFNYLYNYHSPINYYTLLLLVFIKFFKFYEAFLPIEDVFVLTYIPVVFSNYLPKNLSQPSNSS